MPKKATAKPLRCPVCGKALDRWDITSADARNRQCWVQCTVCWFVGLGTSTPEEAEAAISPLLRDREIAEAAVEWRRAEDELGQVMSDDEQGYESAICRRHTAKARLWELTQGTEEDENDKCSDA